MRSRVLIPTVLFVLLAGCGDGDDPVEVPVADSTAAQEDEAAAADEAATATPDPADAPVSSGDESETPDDAPAAPEVQTRVDDIVVGPDDLSDDWVLVPPQGAGSGGDDTPICGRSTNLTDLAAGVGAARADSRFTQSDFGPFLSSFAVGPSPDGAAALDEFVAAATSCDEYVLTDEAGQELSYAVSELALPEIGDDRFAVKLDVTGGQIDATLVLAVAVEDDVLVGVSEVMIGGGADSALVGELLARMIARV